LALVALVVALKLREPMVVTAFFLQLHQLVAVVAGGQ
jgi:hypothetical protein